MIIHADVLRGLSQLDNESVHCCVTSPPYWGLRDYGVEGQLGLEKTPQEYIAKMVEVFSQVRRVLRKDGTCWLNVGDSYSGSGRGADDKYANVKLAEDSLSVKPDWKLVGLKPKDLCLIPFRLAIALQEDGWWVRSDIIWAKPNPMPESVTDRPTKSHEYMFLLTKSAKYYFDQEAVREEFLESGIKRQSYGRKNSWGDTRFADPRDNRDNGTDYKKDDLDLTKGRNIRTVWTIPTQPTPEAHFATFPEALIVPCIKAGTSEKGCCPECGSPWERIIERDRKNRTELDKDDPRYRPNTYSGAYEDINGKGDAGYTTVTTLGWQPTCKCKQDFGSYLGDVLEDKHYGLVPPPRLPIPCIVLDPFFGSGTTGIVAKKLQRNYIGIELNGEYIKIAERRIESKVGGLF